MGDYHRMGEAGVLAPEARVELIEGEIVDMAPIGKAHASIVDRLNRELVQALGERAIVRVQGPVQLGELSEPEPDLALLKPRADFYREAAAAAADVLLIIEVADTTQRYDRRVKVPLYARHGIPQVWVIDLENRLVHFHRRPVGEGYDDVASSAHPGMAPIERLPGVSVDLSHLL
ncbi:MAG: Uma2 family endonuclease [Betaproteobacteria bacterium]